MTENPYRYQIPGHHYVGDLPRRIIDGMMLRGEHIGVVGGRRCGKTSIIKVLESSLPSEALARPVVPVPVYVSGLDRASPGTLFREILRAMTAGLEGYQWSGFVREEEPFDAFKTAVEGRVGSDLTDRHGSEWMAVILIDEIDTLAGRLDEGGYGDVFFGNLRHLVMVHKMYGNFRLVVTGVNDPEGVINRGSPFNMLATLKLGILSTENVDTLIESDSQTGYRKLRKSGWCSSRGVIRTCCRACCRSFGVRRPGHERRGGSDGGSFISAGAQRLRAVVQRIQRRGTEGLRVPVGAGRAKSVVGRACERSLPGGGRVVTCGR